MSNYIYTRYSIVTGLFDATIRVSDNDTLQCVLGPEHSCLLGEFDCLSQMLNLETGLVVDYIPPQPSPNHVYDETTKRWVYVPTDDDLALQARAKRDALLTASDWVTLRAFRTNTAIPEPWLAYQTALADLPLQEGFPREIIWPTIPTEE